MKKLFALIISFAVLLTFVGCSDSKKSDETEFDIEQAVVGTWIYEYVVTASDSNAFDHVGDEKTMTIELYRGGTGSVEWYNITTDRTSGESLSWEAEDVDLINVEFDRIGGSHVQWGLEYDEDDDTLTLMEFDTTFTREGRGRSGGGFSK